MIASHILLGLGWVMFGILHSMLAASTVKGWFDSHLNIKPVVYRIYYIILAMISLTAMVYWTIVLPTAPVFQRSWIFSILGACFGGVGLIIMAICIVKYFATISGLKSLEKSDVQNKLRINGIHKFVRHPLYLGTFIALWGCFLIVPVWSMLIATVLIQAYTQIAIPLEEKKLVAEFGDDYLRYRRTVPRIMPFTR